MCRAGTSTSVLIRWTFAFWRDWWGAETGRQFVLDDDVKGRVTVVTPPQIPKDEVYPLFLSILESSGFTVIEGGAACRILRMPEGMMELPPVMDAGESGAGGLVTKVLQLRHISATDVVKTLQPLGGSGKQARVVAFGPTNHLIISDTVERIRRLEQIIEQLDVAGSARSVEVVALEYAAAEDVARQLNDAMAGAGRADTKVSQHLQQVAGGAGALPTDAVVVPSAQANSLLLVGTPVQMGELKGIIALLDTEDAAGQGPLNAVFLQYMDAEEAAKSLNALLEKKNQKDAVNRIALEADVINNALLIDAGPRDFEWMRDLVKKLDRIPDQVMVEVLIAEVTVGTGLDLGVEWSAVNSISEDGVSMLGRSNPGTTDTLANYLATGVFPQGLLLGIANGFTTDSEGNQVPLIPFLVTALASDDNVKILSNVPLWAQNNKEASVSAVRNIPMLKSTIDKGAGTASDTIQTIERKDIGITLTVTPHVNPNREITLELHPIIEAIVDEGPTGAYTPEYTKREVQTTVTVPNGATIAITGLIREDALETISKIPLLGDIPFLGALFRRKKNTVDRTNLLIFVTPTLVTDMQQARNMKRAWEEKTSLVGPATNVAVFTEFEQP